MGWSCSAAVAAALDPSLGPTTGRRCEQRGVAATSELTVSPRAVPGGAVTLKSATPAAPVELYPACCCVLIAVATSEVNWSSAWVTVEMSSVALSNPPSWPPELAR